MAYSATLVGLAHAVSSHAVPFSVGLWGGILESRRRLRRQRADSPTCGAERLLQCPLAHWTPGLTGPRVPVLSSPDAHACARLRLRTNI